MKPTICLFCIVIIFYFGLRPFNFNSSNGVNWLKAENGIFLHDLGVVYGPTEYPDSDQNPLLAKDKSISIELWLRPGSDGYNRFSYIFGLYDDHYQEILSFSQVKTLLNISTYQNPVKKGSNHKWRWLGNTFFKGQSRFLTITSDKINTTVYLDGRNVKRYQNYSLMGSRKQTSACRMIIGNNPSGKNPWLGKIHGLAIYNHALSQERVNEHFEKWRNESALSLLKEKDIIALYPMDEQKGQIIHNAVLNHYHLSIPAMFKILKKSFLKLNGNAFNFNSASLRDMRINILGFIPLGCLLLVTIYSTNSSRTSSWRLIFLAILGGTVISLIVEILQAFLPTRTSSLTDLIFNTFGTALGVIFACLFTKIKNAAHWTRGSNM